MPEIIGAYKWKRAIKELKALPVTLTADAIRSLIRSARKDDRLDSLELAFSLDCESEGPVLYAQFLRLIAEPEAVASAAAIQEPESVAAALDGRPEDGSEFQRRINSGIATCVDRGNATSELGRACTLFMSAGDLALIGLDEPVRAAAFYQHVQLLKTAPVRPANFQERPHLHSVDAATITTLKWVAEEPSANSDLARSRLRAIARALYESEGNSVAFATIHFRLVCASLDEVTSVAELAEVLRQKEVRLALQRSWKDTPMFPTVIRQVISQLGLDVRRQELRGAEALRDLIYAAQLYGLIDDFLSVFNCLGWAMVAEPAKSEVRVGARMLAKRNGLVDELVAFYRHAIAEHPGTKAMTNLRLELAVLLLVLRKVEEAREAISTVRRSMEDDEARRAIMRAVRSQSPPTSSAAWNLLGQ